jgi:stress response protein YsnF
MNYEKIVTLYDTVQHADAAKRNLEAAGFPSTEMSTINSETLALAADKLCEPGLWRRLFGREVQSYEALVYGRSIQNGGVVLTIRVPETDVPKATHILNSHEAVDLRKRALQEELISGAVGSTGVTNPPIAATARQALNEEVLRLAEEQLDVGKRVISDGMTRIRRFVTVTPVEAQVTLHEEHTRVIRRVISDPGFVRDVDWADKTVEVSEMAEEPVITKSVHIAEEVVIRKEGTDTVKTVRDKIRKQQVEVEKIVGEPSVTSKR